MRSLGLFLGFDGDVDYTTFYGFLSASSPPVSFTRASTGSVRTGTNTLKMLSENECGIGRELSSLELGYSIEQAHGNALIAQGATWGRDPSAWNNTAPIGTVVWSNSGLAGPDGTGNAKRATCAAGNNVSASASTPITKATCSIWVRGVAGGESYQSSAYSATPLVVAVTNGTLSTAWERKEMVTATYSTPGFLYAIRGDNLTAYGGIAAGARDACLDFVQLDTDGVLREYTPNASQPADVLTVKTAYGARQYGYMRFRSKSNSNQATATAYLWYADADNNLKMSSGGVVTLRLGGANVVVTSGVFNFSKSQPLELYWEYGGGMATLIQARINNGSWINLATMVAVPSPTTQYAVLCSGMDVFLCAFLTSNQNSVPRQSAGLLTLSQKNHVPKIPLPWGEVASSAEIEIEATSGTSIIMVYKNTRISDTVFSEIQLATDGVHTSYNTLTALSGVLTPTVSGAHRYRIRDGGNVAMWNGTGWTTSAATVQDLMFRGVATQYIAPPKDRRLVVVGDSIATGATSGHITTNGAFQLLRDDPVLGAVYNVTNCSAGNLAVWDLSDPASGQMGAYADSVVSAMDGITQNVVWVELAFNDYYRSTLSAAQFGPIYGQLLDAIHARAPNAVIIAQSPIPANSEAANSKGSQLGAYRTAIADEAAARPWCTYADGSLWTDITRVPDGIHPNQAGHAAYFAHIAATLPA